MTDFRRRSAALLLVATLGLGLLPSARAEDNVITIRDARDLIELAKDCTSDSWSKDRTVVLADDISLAGTDFSTIPVFRGTFDGAGHTITGFTWLAKGSKTGLFRTLSEGAVVKNLTLDGVVAPDGSQNQVGILAGENYGTIEAVTITGDVTGDEDVGAVVGFNGSTGVLRNCINKAEVTGNTHSGGIAGHNEGLIDHCTNESEINTDGNDAASDTGGITGINHGTIQFCLNTSTVGYSHTGYNTGGIAGRQDGTILSSTNRGTILGRKDVGGIVGQFEPYTVLSYGESPMDQLDEALGGLSTLMSQFAGQVHTVTGDAIGDASAIQSSLSAIQDTADGLASDLSDDTAAAADPIYDSVQTMNLAMGTLLDEVDAFTQSANSDLEEINVQITALRKGLSSLSGALDSGLSDTAENVSFTLDLLEYERNGLISEIQGIAQDIHNIEEFGKQALQSLGQGNLSGILEAYERYGIGSIDLQGRINRINTHLKNLPSEVHSLADRLSELWSDTSSSVSEAKGDMQQASAALEAAISALNTHAKAFSDGSAEQLRVVNTQMDRIEDILNQYRTTLQEKGQQRLDELDQHLDAINDQVTQMTQGAAQANQQLYDTTTAIIQQLDAVRQAISGLTKTPEKIVEENTSEQAAQSGPGRVCDCRNEGEIQADANVGGIAGIVSPELSMDPEEDLDLDVDEEHLLVDTTTLLKAIVYQCDNRGDVSAKNECAGGILGRAEVGAALSCTSMGSVSADGGNYVGGIAGLSRALIRSCAAQADLSGDSSLGGIAGEGHDIQNCAAMTRLYGSGERQGAVAGWADGTVSDNYYLQEDAVGVDGIDYEGQTTPLSFSEFSALESVPQDFLSFSVTFQAGDQVVACIDVPYGGRLTSADFPEVPSDGGRYGEWALFDRDYITRSLTVEAVYEDWVTTISSGGTRPLLLAEGDFSPNALLSVQMRDDQPVSGAVAAYDYAITDGTNTPDTVTLRVLADDADGVALYQDGNLIPVEAQQDGSYLIFEAPGNGTVVLTTSTATPILLWSIAAAAAGVIVLLLLYRRRTSQKDRTSV